MVVVAAEECPVAKDPALGDEDWFVSFALGQLQGIAGLGSIEMFGGHGLFFGRTFFGIMSAGRLYLKTDHATVGEYVRRGRKAFRSGETGALRSFFELPADVLHDRERLAEWVRAAVRSAMATRPAWAASAGAAAG